MRFTAAIFTTLAVGALAAVAPEVEEEFSTVMLTETTTLCPEATSGALPASSDLPSITVSDGITYSISRPLITSTVTYCNECPSATPNPIYTPVPVPSSSSSSSSSSIVVPTSRPLIPTAPVEVPVPVPSAPAPSSVSPETGSDTEPETTTAPAGPLFTGAASRAAAGAGAGLAGVFALVAYLL